MSETTYHLLWSPIKETKRSTSAGGFYLIARKFLEEHQGNASVYGAAFEDVRTVKHIRVTEIDELVRLQGSKYVQSDMSDCYKLIRQDLESQRYVLFSGTSCQAAAVKEFPFRNKERLFVIDVLCHGVPSPKLWREHVDYLEKKRNGEISQVYFRNKSNTNRMGYLLKYSSNGKRYTEYQDNDVYYKAFIDGDSLRPSCYVCPYVGEYQTSDLTLADSNNKQFHPYEAISLAIVRSNKGEQLLQSIAHECEYCNTLLELECIDNKKLIRATKKTENRDLFYFI